MVNQMTEQEALQVIEDCEKLRLEGADFLRELGPIRVAKASNGIGPEWFPVAIREKVTEYFFEFILASIIHDCRYTYDNDGYRKKYNWANIEFERNCKRIYRKTTHWWTRKRWQLRSKAKFLVTNVNLFGWEAYKNAYDELVNGVA